MMMSVNSTQFDWIGSFILFENAHMLQLSTDILSLLLHAVSCVENNYKHQEK